MNWKKFLIETTVIVGVAAAALLYAPAFLAAKPIAYIWGAELGIGALGLWLEKKAWDNSWSAAPQVVAITPKIEAQPQKAKTKQTKRVQEVERHTPRRWGMKLPRFVSRHSRTKEGTERQNYRDAA